MMTDYEGYLHDLGLLLKELAIEAKQKASDGGSDFSVGYLAGFHRVISLMQQQGEAFHIPMSAIGLEGIDPDDDLV
ncbi:hypothetical protein [Massilia sp. BKSP1R2A-1]|jgi:hypothetical protein|uniref:hypothetical protein n=1 Tax=Massilia sp. BKSP1R2A-1 TaxID=3422595 RepID=UPI003D33AEDC